jgi:hypothetical protein
VKAGVVLDDAAIALRELAGDIETEEADMAREMSAGGEEDDDDDESLLDARSGMSEEEIAELEESVEPVRLILVKVLYNIYFFTVICYLIIFKAAQDCLRYQELHHNYSPKVELDS